MKKSFLLLPGMFLLILGISSCSQQAPMDATRMQAKIDSIYNSKKQSVMSDVDQLCKASFNDNVKAKCDSMCKAMMDKKM